MFPFDDVIMTVSADAIVPNGAGPPTGIVLIKALHTFYKFPDMSLVTIMLIVIITRHGQISWHFEY